MNDPLWYVCHFLLLCGMLHQKKVQYAMHSFITYRDWVGQAKGPTTHSFQEERVTHTANILIVLFILFTVIHVIGGIRVSQDRSRYSGIKLL